MHVEHVFASRKKALRRILATQIAQAEHTASNYIEDIWLFQCKMILCHRMNTKRSIFTSGGATSENITFGVYEWNKNWSYTEKVKFSVSFML